MNHIFSLLAFLVLTLLHTEHAFARNQYSVYVPKDIRPGQPINYVVNNLNTTETLEITGILFSKTLNISIDVAFVQPGASKMISTVNIPMDFDNRDNSLKLEVTGLNADTGEFVFSNKTSDFIVAFKTQSLFIQTDKAIYQPGQTIKFRAVNLDFNLKPLSHNLSYEIIDPKSNIVLLKKNQVPTLGVVSDELQIHEDSPVGGWRILVTDDINEFSKEAFVDIKVYKLPKFEVKVEVPSYHYRTLDGFTVKIQAKYTYGKPVLGQAFLLVKIINRWMYEEAMMLDDEGFPVKSSIKTVDMKFLNFTGEAEMFVSTKDLEDMGWKENRNLLVKVYGMVLEAFTDIKFDAEETINLEEQSIKIASLYSPKVCKPGLMYTAYLKVSEMDEKLIQESFREGNKVLFEAETKREPFYGPYPSLIKPPLTTTEPQDIITEEIFDILPDGTVIINYEVPDVKFYRVQFTASINGSKSVPKLYWSARPAESPSNTYIQIITNETTFEPETKARFTVRSNTVIRKLLFTIKSRKNILSDQQITYDSNSKSVNFELLITRQMSPSATILVSYVRQDGEIVADYITITVGVSLENKVNVESSTNNTDAGSNVKLSVQTSEAGSYVGLKAIDKSVLLLKSANEISMTEVKDDIRRYTEQFSWMNSYRWFWWPMSNDGLDAEEIFYFSNIEVLTDANLYSRRVEFSPIGPYGGTSIIAEPASLRDLKTGTVESKPRTYFPETWLWEEQISDDEGIASFNTTAPDTITSWVLSTFSVSKNYGLGIADTSQITVFRNFFINLNVPLKVTRGEIIIVQAIIFNYFKMDLEVVVKLEENSNGFELIMPVDDEAVAGRIRRIKIRAEDQYSISFPLKMNQIGEIDIQVSASSVVAADSLIRKISVKPEGIQQCFSESALIKRDVSTKEDTVTEFDVKIPLNIVPGSANMKLYIYGDIMGSTRSNLGSLLREPTGCGEQNMMSFAPDVFVTLYLRNAGILDEETKETAYKHFLQGYQNQLNYRHPDGSYSAFGERDESGSLWLTAFVVKCFKQAGLVRPEMQEQLSRNIEDAVSFIFSQINKDGSFKEPGSVNSRSIQGGVDSPITMAAYALISLTEIGMPTGGRKDEDKKMQNIASARSFLEDNLDSIKSSPFALSIVTYALYTSESSRADEAFEALEQLAVISDGNKYWNENEAFSSKYSNEFRPSFYKPPSNDIEMTAYALLSYVRRGDLMATLPVLKWLASKRNEFGGYSSTQNTVIAIQAMSEVAAMFVGESQDMVVTAEKDGIEQSFKIMSYNSMVLNRIDFPATDGKVKIEASGVGVAVAQMSTCYNVDESPFSDSPFDCKIQISDENVNFAALTFCCRLKNSSDNSTGMLLYEINLPNGFSVNLDDEITRNREAKLIEFKKGSANYYYDELSQGNEICATTQMKRYQQIAGSKPPTITVQDYYQPGTTTSYIKVLFSFEDSQIRFQRRFLAKYSIAALEQTTVCSICGSDCAGCPAAYLSEWKIKIPCMSYCSKKGEFSYYERDCFDPGMKKNVAVSKCGLVRKPYKKVTCKKNMLPYCPDLIEGLWGTDYDSNKIYRNKKIVTGCTRMRNIYQLLMYFPRQSAPSELGFKGIPCVTLESNDYLSCSSKLFEQVDINLGLTVSLLVYVNKFPTNKVTTIFSYGSKLVGTPTFELKSTFWSSKYVIFSASVGYYEYRTTRISSKQLLNKWNQILVTWSLRGHSVYINGQKQGIDYSYASRRINQVPSDGEFLLGKSIRSRFFEENLDGYFSGLAGWNRKFSGDDALQTYNFFKKMLVEANDDIEPILTSRMQNYLSSPLRGNGKASCFSKEMTLRELKKLRVNCSPYY